MYVSDFQQFSRTTSPARCMLWICIYPSVCQSVCLSQVAVILQEAQLLPRDRAMRQLKSCQLPRNSAETTCTTSPEQIEVMKLVGYSGAMCNKHVHSTMTRSSRFHCPTGVINKPTKDKLWMSPVYRRLAVAKFSKYTM